MKDLKGRRVLVAGGSGLVGANLVARLVGEGADVVATHLTRPPPHHAELYRTVDLRTVDACAAAAKGRQDVVVCAAKSAGAAIMRDRPSELILPNLEIHAAMLEGCRVAGVERVVLLSSTTVYQASDSPLREEDLDLHRSPPGNYQGIGGVMRYVEQLARFYADRYAMRIALLRPSAIYGPHDKLGESSNVIPALIRRALAKEDPFVVWGDGTAERDFVFVDDVVDDVLAALAGPCSSDPVHSASGTTTTIAELVRIVLDAAGHRVEPRYDATKPDAIRRRIFDVAKMTRVLAPSHRTPLAEGVRRTVEWVRSTRKQA